MILRCCLYFQRQNVCGLRTTSADLFCRRGYGTEEEQQHKEDAEEQGGGALSGVVVVEEQGKASGIEIDRNTRSREVEEQVVGENPMKDVPVRVAVASRIGSPFDSRLGLFVAVFV
ncbi:hypothetical protein E3N88_10442 [Mikania micrantha]|uniref:Uncharacterized protein n=1 Tax=Mikania micrantha TaxID=192012 RepID=A0A5N6PAH8_9ASTR|nr:hypothetical protein E3N88_10442 [Mikania micrantha]